MCRLCHTGDFVVKSQHATQLAHYKKLVWGLGGHGGDNAGERNGNGRQWLMTSQIAPFRSVMKRMQGIQHKKFEGHEIASFPRAPMW